MSTKKIKIKKNLLKEAKKALQTLESFQYKNGNGNIFLFEEAGIKEVAFQSILESEQTIEEIAQTWEKSATHQLEEIMGMDFATAGAGAAGAAASGREMAKDTAWAAVESVNDAIIMLYIQGKDLIISALSKAVGAVKAVLGPVLGIMKKIWGAIKRFCSSHPIICKVIAIALMVLVIFLVVSILGSEAQAKITVDGKQLSDTEVGLLKGFVQDVGGHGPVDAAADKLGSIAKVAGVDVPDAGGEGVSKLAVDTVNWIDEAHRATESIELTTAQEDGGKIAREAFNFLVKLWKGKEGQGASEGMKDIFQSWVDAGKDLIGSFEQTIERTAGHIRQNTKVGWDQIPSDPETGARVLPQTFQKVQQSLNEELKRMKELAGIL